MLTRNKIFFFNSALIILTICNMLWNFIGFCLSPGPSLPIKFIMLSILINSIAIFLCYLNIKKVPTSLLMSFMLILFVSSDTLSSGLRMFYAFLMKQASFSLWGPTCTASAIALAQLVFSGGVLIYSLWLMFFKHKSLKEVAI